MTLNPERCGNCGDCVNCNAEWAAMHEDRIAGRPYLKRLGRLAQQAMRTLNLSPERRALVVKTLKVEETCPSPNSTQQIADRLHEKAAAPADRLREHMSQPHATSPRQPAAKGLPAPAAPSLFDRIRAKK